MDRETIAAAQTMPPLAIFGVSTLLVVLLIVRFKLNAFVALVTAAVAVGLLSPTVPLGDVMKETAQGFGRVAGQIGIAIAMAAIVGDCLTQSGAADRIVRRLVAFFGEKRASLSLLSSGYLLAIPVFFDTVFYLLVPLARAMSVRMGGRQYVLLTLAISAGGSATHVFVPPTPGPLVMAANLGVDVGLTILVGLAVAFPASLCAWAYATWIDARLEIQPREAPGASLRELEEVAALPESQLPSLASSLVPILLPLVLITSSTVGQLVAPDGRVAGFLGFVGDANFSLMLAAAAGLALLARQRSLDASGLAKTVNAAIASAGVIILITAAGGAFGGMLVKAGVGEALGAFAKNAGLSHLWLGFLLAALFKLAQGSGTVTMITVSAILGPLVVASPPPYHAVYLVMAVGAGALVGQWMNDSGFWIYRTMTGLDEIETLQAKSVMMAVLGTSAFAVTLLLSVLLPLV
ncbi:MAG TPA: SLC13 family permease [Vicinamibacteria bacterium]